MIAFRKIIRDKRRATYITTYPLECRRTNEQGQGQGRAYSVYRKNVRNLATARTNLDRKKSFSANISEKQQCNVYLYIF